MWQRSHRRCRRREESIRRETEGFKATEDELNGDLRWKRALQGCQVLSRVYEVRKRRPVVRHAVCRYVDQLLCQSSQCCVDEPRPKQSAGSKSQHANDVLLERHCADCLDMPGRRTALQYFKHGSQCCLGLADRVEAQLFECLDHEHRLHGFVIR